MTSENILLNNVQDAVDLIGNCSYSGSNKIIVYQKNIAPAFFDLKTGIAGDILQKFSTYRSQLAIVGDFLTVESKSLRAFMYESNKTGHIFFVNSLEEATRQLSA
jgi:hypothetical protein